MGVRQKQPAEQQTASTIEPPADRHHPLPRQSAKGSAERPSERKKPPWAPVSRSGNSWHFRELNCEGQVESVPDGDMRNRSFSHTALIDREKTKLRFRVFAPRSQTRHSECRGGDNSLFLKCWQPPIDDGNRREHCTLDKARSGCILCFCLKNYSVF